jgi:hypothetical protein
MADGAIDTEEIRKRLAVMNSDAARSYTGDEHFKFVVTTTASAEGQPARFDGIYPAIEERFQLDLGEPSAKTGTHLEAELLKLAQVLLLAQTSSHPSDYGTSATIVLQCEHAMTFSGPAGA